MTRRKKKYFVTTRRVAPDGLLNYGYAHSSLRAAFYNMLRRNAGYLAGINIRKEVYNAAHMHYIRNIKSGKVWDDPRTEGHVDD